MRNKIVEGSLNASSCRSSLATASLESLVMVGRGWQKLEHRQKGLDNNQLRKARPTVLRLQSI